MPEKEKQIILTPSHKALFWWYVLGLLLIPVFGMGIYLIYRFYSIQKSIEYRITDRQITIRDSKTSENIDLAAITDTGVSLNRTGKWFGIGDVVIKTRARTATIAAQENPERLASLIIRAAEAERKRLSAKPVKPDMEKAPKPGTLDKLDYLTGLWQQGLLSDEDYQKEKKHFE
jgi:hypothetical protein